MSDQPIKEPNKGNFGWSCNRSACDNVPATFYNQSTRKYYCAECAARINKLNWLDAQRLFNSELCLHFDKPMRQTSWRQLSDREQYHLAYGHALKVSDPPKNGHIEQFLQMLEVGQPELFISEDGRTFQIAAVSIDVMKVIVKNYFKP